MTTSAYVYNPDVAHMLELEQQVRQLKQELHVARANNGRLRNLNTRMAQRAANEINRSTRVYVERIRDLQTIILFLESQQQP